jgi:hypothetical protein
MVGGRTTRQHIEFLLILVGAMTFLLYSKYLVDIKRKNGLAASLKKVGVLNCSSSMRAHIATFLPISSHTNFQFHHSLPDEISQLVSALSQLYDVLCEFRECSSTWEILARAATLQDHKFYCRLLSYNSRIFKKCMKTCKNVATMTM